MRDKAYRRAAWMCATCATREGRKNTTTLFLEHRLENTHDENADANPTKNTAELGPGQSISVFLVQNTDKAHTDKTPKNRRRRGNDVASTIHFIYIDHHPS
jgi:hypothetical protein